MRCPDCNKFVSLENGEPEENSLEIYHLERDNYQVTGEYRLPRCCADCSTELKEGVFTFDFNIDIPGVTDEERDNVGVEMTDMEVKESGGGRYAKNVFSLNGIFRIATTERELIKSVETNSDELNAGSFDELV